jgi:hypothetical protein
VENRKAIFYDESAIDFDMTPLQLGFEKEENLNEIETITLNSKLQVHL